MKAKYFKTTFFLNCYFQTNWQRLSTQSIVSIFSNAPENKIQYNEIEHDKKLILNNGYLMKKNQKNKKEREMLNIAFNNLSNKNQNKNKKSRRF